jgi:hypothetical protein
MQSKKKLSEAIRKTLIYSDLFDYPLRFDELYTFLIAKETVSPQQLKDVLRTMKSVSTHGDYSNEICDYAWRL